MGRGCTLGKKENSIESPTLALISLGTNVRAPPLPTCTGMVVAACAREAEAAARRTVEKYMLT